MAEEDYTTVPDWLEWFFVAETNSTNDQVHACAGTKEITLVHTDFQTQGRGQKGNSWESERGKNIIASLLLHPTYVNASQMFILSQAFSLAIQQTLLPILGKDVRIKWPNDIYWKDKKICGILIENTLMGRHIENCTIGFGLNVNQIKFESNAPNPISIRQITGEYMSHDALLMDIVTLFHAYLDDVKHEKYAAIIQLYKDNLYRNEGMHLYKDSQGEFLAKIVDIDPQGPITLQDAEGRIRKYAFKEVKYLITNYEL